MSARRVATLDGLRGVAVLLVVFGHAIGTFTAEEEALHRALSVVFNGGVGVTLFFVLSGYLITGILARERERTGQVSFRNFYVRRTLRILPAFYVFLTVVAVLAVAGTIEVRGSQLISAGLFVWNYSPAAEGWWLGHTWSLAIEEQFYLLWPLALAFLRPQRACWIAVGYLVAAPAIRLFNYVLFPGVREDVWMMFHARADALLLGCLLALLPSAYPKVWQRLRRVAQHRWGVSVAVVAVLVSSALELALGGLWNLPLGLTVTTLAAGLLLVVAVGREGVTPFVRLLRWRLLTAVGLISYSLYLWQQLFLAPEDIALPVVGTPLVGLVAAFGAATLSYHLVEQPFLRLKERLQSVPTATRLDPLGVTPQRTVESTPADDTLVTPALDAVRDEPPTVGPHGTTVVDRNRAPS